MKSSITLGRRWTRQDRIDMAVGAISRLTRRLPLPSLLLARKIVDERIAKRQETR